MIATEHATVDLNAIEARTNYHVSVIIVIREHDAGRAVDGLADERLGQVMLVPNRILAVAVPGEARG